eukprot:m.84375 g.84375  ORF g.84375 m.84375 type:complete len:338 (+) comp8197_c0_seq1:261-1274(+)
MLLLPHNPHFGSLVSASTRPPALPAPRKVPVRPMRVAGTSDQSSTEDNFGPRTVVNIIERGPRDAEYVRQLKLNVGRPEKTLQATFYVPERIFEDNQYAPIVQERTHGYEVAGAAPKVPISQTVYGAANYKMRRSTLEPDEDSAIISGSPRRAGHNAHLGSLSTDHSSMLFDSAYSGSQVPPSTPQPGGHPRAALPPIPSTRAMSPPVVTAQPTKTNGESSGGHGHGGHSGHKSGKKKGKKEAPLELIGFPRLRRELCTLLILPFICCFPRDRTGREAMAFFIYYVIFNVGFFLAIILTPPTPTPWVTAARHPHHHGGRPFCSRGPRSYHRLARQFQ